MVPSQDSERLWLVPRRLPPECLSPQLCGGGTTEDESTRSAGTHTRCFERKHRRNLLSPLPAAILGLDKVVVAFMA
jgi:hypothetical protein